MSYKDHVVTGVRKVKWDGLWHVMYAVKYRDMNDKKKIMETWDRVSKKEALKVAETL